MICKRCGSQIFNNAKTCPFCAAVVGAENETDLTQSVIPSLEELEAPGNQMPDLGDPVQPPAAPVSQPAQNHLFDIPSFPPMQPSAAPAPSVQPEQQNPFAMPAGQPVQPPAAPSVQPVQQNPFAMPAGQPVQPPAAPSVQPAQQNPFAMPAGQPVQQNPFDTPADPNARQNPFGAPQQPAAMQNSPSVQQPSFAPLPPLSGVGGGSGTGGGAIAGVPVRLLTKIVLVLALIAFCLPFVTISCSMGGYGGEQEIATYTGFDLMAGNLEYDDPTQQMNDSLSSMFGEEFVNAEDGESDFDQIFGDDDNNIFHYYDEDDDDYDFEDDDDGESAEIAAAEEEAADDTQRKNYFLIAAFISGIAAFGIFFVKGKQLELVTMLLSALSAMLTLVSSITFSSFYHVTDDPEMAELIVVKTRYGLYVVVVLFVLGALGALKEHIDIRKNGG